MGVPNTSDHIQIQMEMQTPNTEPPMSSKAHIQDFKDMDVLCTFQIKRGQKLLGAKFCAKPQTS